MNFFENRPIRMLRRTAFLISAAAVILSGVSCASKPVPANDAAAVKPPARVGLFLDEGCRGNAVLCWARLIERSPQLELVTLTGKDIREGKLKGLKLLVCPGGGSARQLRAMQKSGIAELKQFIAGGGSYVGACAGCYSVTNHPGRLGLLPFDYISKASGKYAALIIEITEPGAKRLGIKPGRYTVRYHGGPVLRPGPATGKGEGEVLAVYKNSAGWPDRAPYNFVNTPSAIYGTYGKGKVVAVSFHPESWEATHGIALGCIYAATGIRPVPVYPRKSWHPVRVGYCTRGAAVNPRAVREMLALDRNPELDVQFFSTQEVCEGILNHLDAVILSDGVRDSYKKMMDEPVWREGLRKFLDRGGLILASGSGAEFAPEHANLKKLKIDEDMAPHLLKNR